ncbi:MAG TPA: hypothetical protein VK698_14485 [Kofleriaceae bacterium]|nr:hypothetical protein [Kofleriaceae bacterium]
MRRGSGSSVLLCSFLLVAAGPGCGPHPLTSEEPAAIPARSPARPPPSAGAPPTGRPVLVGQMCPTAAAGRAAVRPLFRRASGWTDQAAAVAAPVERHGARQFAVLGWNGRRAGVFSVAGAATIDGGAAAIGAYAGGSPCEKPRGAGGVAGQRDPECVAALRDCGLAVSEVEQAGGFQARPAEEQPDPIDLEVSGACVAGGKLLVDVDRDGALEAYPTAGLIDASGGPADAVEAVAAAGATCPARFAGRALAPGVDLIGVLDLDADGRQDLVLAFERGGRRTWALYAATASAGRLDRVAMAAPWPPR